MSDFGLFESDEAAALEPRVAARTAARKMEAAIDVVRAKFGRFLLGATGIDEFGDRWHYSKHDIRAAVEPYIFPNTGTMRRLHNALKQDWKAAHPYKLAIDSGMSNLELGERSYDESQAELGDMYYGPGRSGPKFSEEYLRKHPERFPHGHGLEASRRQALSHDEAGFGSMPEGDGPPKNLDTDETYHPSDGNLVPKGDFEGWKDSVDQDGPEKVDAHAFTPGGDSGSDKHARRRQTGGAGSWYDQAERAAEMYDPDDPTEYDDDDDEWDAVPVKGNGNGRLFRKRDKEAARLVADIYTDFARANGLRVASLDTLDAYASTGIHQADYRLLASMIVQAAEDCDEACDDDEDSDSEAPSASESDESDADEDSDEDYDFGGDSAAEGESEDSEDDDETDDSDSSETESDEDYGFGDADGDGDHDHADHHDGGGEQFTVPEHAPELPPEMMGEIPQGDTDGSAPVPPEVIDSLLGLPEGTIEQLLLEEVEQGAQGGAPQGGGDDFFGGGGGDNTEPPRVARRRTASLHDETDFGTPFSIDESGQVGPSHHYGPETGYLQLDHDGQSLDDDIEGLDDWQPLSGFTGQFGYNGPVMHPSEYLGGGLEKHIRSNPGHYVTFPIDGMRPGQDEAESVGWGVAYKPHHPSDRTAARRRQAKDYVNRSFSARSFWAAEGDPEQESEGGGGEQQAAPAQDPAAGGAPMDPAAAMGGGQPMLPPPGSQAVQPPQPPMPIENQPAEDALLDTANQAIMQMIDRETQEYQQIIDPLSQALQAIQFAQQVEQAEHPMDVTPPQGTVDVSPSAAPGGQAPQQPMQQMARRRVAGGDPYADSYGDIDRGGPSIDDPTSGPTYQRVHPDIEKALRRRFDGGGSAGWHPDKPGVILHDLGNFWDGPREVKHLGGGELEYTCPYTGRSDRFNAAGYYTHDGEHRPWSSDHYGSMRRQAKVETALRNAAALIASRYRLSATGHRMLLQATLGRRGYEHVVEALKLVPPEVRKAAALHMSHLFAAGNQRFNRDVFMKTVMASNPRDRAGDAWRDGRDRGFAEHGRHDLDDFGDELGDRLSPGGNRRHRPGGFDPHDHDEWVDGTDRRASRGRLPFDLPRRQAGETWMNTSLLDEFEFPNPGVPEITDKHTVNNLPKMPGGHVSHRREAETSQKAVDRFQRWQRRQQQMGLPTTQGESAVHNFLQTSRPYKKRVGPDAADMIHRELGLQPDAVKTPKAKPVKAVNPALGKGGGQTPKAPKAKAPAPKAAPKTASFFTRKVPGWRWDDHLSGYLAKEARAFTCSCGQKVAAPSYKTCSCGKIWNVYAIGDTHHLASDTAEVYIAREIPVRPGVVMANRKLAGFNDTHAIITEHDTAQSAYLDSGHPVDKEYLDQVRGELMERVKAGDPDAIEWSKGRSNFDPDKTQDPFDPRLIGAAARKSHRELVAEIERLADWTKYDSPDPLHNPKAKPPSTTIKSQPGDWTNRDFTGPTKGQWREPDPTELPRKTRKKK